MSVSRSKWILLSFFFLVSFALSSCGSVSLGDIFPNRTTDSSDEVMVDVTFFVQIPLNTPEGEIIYLSTLDEVTGLGVNAQHIHWNLLWAITILIKDWYTRPQ